MIDIFFDLYDLAGRHPGVESHAAYAEQIKEIMRDLVGIMNKKLKIFIIICNHNRKYRRGFSKGRTRTIYQHKDGKISFTMIKVNVSLI